MLFNQLRAVPKYYPPANEGFPPFGVDWGKDENVKKAVLKDNAPEKRFAAGLPSTSDGSLLFLMHMISKMDDTQGSRIGIVLNGSPLFNGGAGSGWSNIRKMLLDRNLLDAIVALPKNLFYGTDISSYLWIIDNKRPVEKYHKALFIDATCEYFTTPLQKSLGKKRFEISKIGAEAIMLAYKAYDNFFIPIDYLDDGTFPQKQIAKLLDYDDFLYTQVSVQRPLRLSYEGVSEKYFQMSLDEGFAPESAKNRVLAKVAAIKGIDIKRTDSEFFALLKKEGIKVSATDVKLIRASFGERDEDAPEVLSNPYKYGSGLIADTSLSDNEIVPMKKDINEFFAEEVLPFASDAWMERDKDKVGCEFPLTKLFYEYKPLRSSEEILAELKALDAEMESDIDSL